MKVSSLIIVPISAICMVFCELDALAQDESLRPLTLQSGHSIILPEPGLRRIAIGDGNIAGVLPIGTQQIVVNGKAPGHTTIFIWNKYGRISYNIEVTQQEVDNFASLVRESVDLPGVSVSAHGHMVVVHGQVNTNEEYARLCSILSQFAEGSGGKEKASILNVVTVLHPLGALLQEIHQMPGASSIRVDPDGKGNVVVSGFVADRATAERVLGHVKGLAGPFLSADGKVVDRIETATSAVIDIKINVLEVDESGQRDLGNYLQSALLNPQDDSYSLGTPLFPLIEGAAPAIPGKGATIGTGLFRTYLFAPTLQALITEGHARTLASPDLSTVPGTEADFLVGGEVPYVFSSGSNSVSVGWKDYGVQLKVTPTILPNGSIQAVIAPEVSELDQANAAVENGFSIPGVTTSKLSTTAVTRPGESVVLGGMLRRVESRTIAKWPILGNLPILGKLFSSTNYQMSKTNVVFVLTPTIINR